MIERNEPKWAYRTSEFTDPPAIFWPGYFWLLNEPLEEQTIKRQLQQMAACGARSVCIFPVPTDVEPDSFPTRFSPPYLSEPYFRMIRVMVEEADRLGMNFWLYDEAGWPSGGACGQVFKADPERFCMKVLTRDETTGAVSVKKDYSGGNLGGKAPYIDVLNPDAVKTFIELTHERYRKHLKEYFGQTIHFAFTDEPGTAFCRPGEQLPWTDDMADVFLLRNGYDLTPFLTDLVSKPPVDGETPELTRARVDFYDTCSQLFVERYLQPIRHWCRKNGLLSSGHLRGDSAPEGNANQNYGHILRALRGLDVPGIDAIWRQTFPLRTAETDGSTPSLREKKTDSHFPKYASSVARQAGQPLTMTELYAVYGNGLTPAQMKWITDQQYVFGANLIVGAVFPYGNTDHHVAAFRPHFCPSNTLWRYMDVYHCYAARLGYLLTRGRVVCDTAVYYDVRSIWAGASDQDRAVKLHFDIAGALLGAQCDFDYVDDDAIAAADIQDTSLVIGQMRYHELILPTTRWLDKSAAATISRFIDAGGKVISIAGKIGCDGQQPPFVCEDRISVCSAGDVVDYVTPVIKIVPSVQSVRACKRQTDHGAVYFITNEDDKEYNLSVMFSEKGPVSLADLEKGTWYALNSKETDDGSLVDIKLWPWGSAVICFGQMSDQTQPVLPEDAEAVALEQGWRIKPLREYRTTDRIQVIESPRRQTESIKPGDWRHALGEWFSGDAEYSIDFEIKDSSLRKSCWLDLGTVRYACEVLLNRKSLGRRIWKPFLFDLTGELKTGTNRLVVVVTNTMANSTLNPETVHLWNTLKGKTWPREVLFADQPLEFESESLPSGLFGPIRLLFE